MYLGEARVRPRSGANGGGAGRALVADDDDLPPGRRPVRVGLPRVADDRRRPAEGFRGPEQRLEDLELAERVPVVVELRLDDDEVHGLRRPRGRARRRRRDRGDGRRRRWPRGRARRRRRRRDNGGGRRRRWTRGRARRRRRRRRGGRRRPRARRRLRGGRGGGGGALPRERVQRAQQRVRQLLGDLDAGAEVRDARLELRRRVVALRRREELVEEHAACDGADDCERGAELHGSCSACLSVVWFVLSLSQRRGSLLGSWLSPSLHTRRHTASITCFTLPST